MSDFLSSGVVGDVLNFAGNLKLGPWAWGLQPASFRGVRFAVRSSTIRRGRRVVVHEYPFRDDVWVEDLGRGTRVVSFSGFLIGDDVFAQRDRMVTAVETPGVGVLVHPSLGRLTVSNTEFSAGERFDLGRVVELEFSFIQSTPQPVFPTSGFATALKSIAAAVQTTLAIARDYISAVTTVISGVSAGLTFAANVFGTVRGLIGGVVGMALAVVHDSGALASTALGLSGNNGRYSGGTSVTRRPASTTVASAIAATTVARGAVTAAAAAVSAVSDPSLLPAALQALTEAVRAVAQDPAAQVRILSGLAAYPTPGVSQSPAPLGTAMSAIQAVTASLVRVSALVSIANALANWSPSSWDDAIAMLQSVTALLDAEIIAAADAGLTTTYLALRAQRAAITADLLARAAKLPRLRTVTNRMALPSLTLAYSLYGDATRSDELIRRANPIAPLFMPLSFQALSS